MKTTKKFLALLVTLAMVLSLAVPTAFAEDTTGPYEVFVKNDAENHVYDAYQIFTGDLSSDGTTLSNVEWGASVSDSARLVEALLSDEKVIKTTTGTTTLKQIFSTVATITTDKQANEVATILGTVPNDSNILDRFAEVVGKVNSDGQTHAFLGSPASSVDQQTTKIIQDVATKGYMLDGLHAGYYLIKDRDKNSNLGEGDFYTKYIMRVVKSADISVKGEGVTVQKTVNDTLGGTFTDTEDANTNDTLYFKWEGKLPNNLESYDEYNYKFIDTMSAGLRFNRIEQVYIENANGTPAYTIMDVTDGDDTNDSLSLEKNGIIFPTPAMADGQPTVFSLEIVDLYKTYPQILPSQKIIVKYSAALTRDALIKDENSNVVKVEYDNNPNGEGTGTTVSDKASVFTFKIDIDKFDAANENLKLEGVEFILYERDTSGAETVYHYAQVVTEEMIAAGTAINGRVVDEDDLGLVYGFTTEREEASILDTDENGSINLKGLDSGLYYLEETKTNDGYNLLDTPVQIEILPAYDEVNGEFSATVEYKVDSRTQGSSSTVGVRNSKGSTLPSTGGMGTTILYLGGGALVLCAIVLLITKKRMAMNR